MVKDLISNSIKNLKKNNINSLKKIYLSKDQIICFSSNFKKIENEIKFFLQKKMYNNKNVLLKNNEGKKIIKKLFITINKNPIKFLTKEQLKVDKERAIADYISGMTDRYAINIFRKIK